jgi:hypothetical protein
MRIKQERCIIYTSILAGLLALTLGCPGTAFAQFISSNDLFLAPTDVPTDFYNERLISPGNSITFSVADVPGATGLLGVQILPVLAANPANSAGDYTASELANISVNNYGTYYAFQPNVDYKATTISNNASTATFGAEGTYFVQLKTTNGSSLKTTLIEVNTGDFFAEDPGHGVKDKAGPSNKIPSPSSNFQVISDDPMDNDAMKNAMKQFPNAPKLKNLNDLCKAVMEKFKANGNKKFSLDIIAHGYPGGVKIGTDYIDPRFPNLPGYTGMTPAQVQECLDPYVNCVTFYSCNTYSGAQGEDFIKAFRASIDTVQAFTGTVTISTTYFDEGAGSKKLNAQSPVPEPDSLALLIGFGISGTLFAFRRLRRRRN